MNTLYDAAKEAFLTRGIGWTTDVIRVVLVNTTYYVVQPSHHRVLADVPAQARVATSPPLGGTTATGGVADAADVLIPAVTGPRIDALILYQDTGDPNTSRLIAYIEDAVGLPYDPDGGDIVIRWDDGPHKIFRL